jgi:hypothetical protein
VIPFATFRFVSSMEGTVFAILILVHKILEATVFATSVAQVLVASTTSEIVAMLVRAHLACVTTQNAITFATTKHAVTMVENAQFLMPPQVSLMFRKPLRQSLEVIQELVLSLEQRNLLSWPSSVSTLTTS